jgi:hypothetical protein
MTPNRSKSRTIEEVLSKLSDDKLMGDFDEIFKIMPVTEETSCGIGFFRGPTLQKYLVSKFINISFTKIFSPLLRFANKKVLVIAYGVLSLVFAATSAFFNGTITTVEKRCKYEIKISSVIRVI